MLQLVLLALYDLLETLFPHPHVVDIEAQSLDETPQILPLLPLMLYHLTEQREYLLELLILLLLQRLGRERAFSHHCLLHLSEVDDERGEVQLEGLFFPAGGEIFFEWLDGLDI